MQLGAGQRDLFLRGELIGGHAKVWLSHAGHAVVGVRTGCANPGKRLSRIRLKAFAEVVVAGQQLQQLVGNGCIQRRMCVIG
ncbi:hypothetical protein XGA_1778 [Xanthomonas hortorum ATCC 19865]|nr:hypothetical protein XGA_1778 [Xanthomonas hortorum ATCC 19865]